MQSKISMLTAFKFGNAEILVNLCTDNLLMLLFVNMMQHLDREGISFCCRTTYDDNAITNALEIFNTSR